jgi:hypothetical protein
VAFGGTLLFVTALTSSIFGPRVRKDRDSLDTAIVLGFIGVLILLFPVLGDLLAGEYAGKTLAEIFARVAGDIARTEHIRGEGVWRGIPRSSQRMGDLPVACVRRSHSPHSFCHRQMEVADSMLACSFSAGCSLAAVVVVAINKLASKRIVGHPTGLQGEERGWQSGKTWAYTEVSNSLIKAGPLMDPDFLDCRVRPLELRSKN